MRKLISFVLIVMSVWAITGCGEERIQEEPVIRESNGNQGRASGGKAIAYLGINE